ncbi:hypothetical protein MBLNU230_g0154t1 [Neophaeotheca triangularis]
MNGLTNGVSTPNVPNGASRANDVDALNGDNAASVFWERYEEVQAHNLEANRLLSEVIRRYEHVTRLHQNSINGTTAEREWFRACKQKEAKQAATIKTLHDLLNLDPHVLVLIDGNGMLFDNDLFNAGERGGRKAAVALHGAVSEWAVQTVTQCPSNVKIIVRVYANIRGLVDICTRAGIVDSPGKMEDFARGFNGSMALCDFIDAPNGNSAEAKIAEIFKLYLNDYHCRQILLGCSQVGFKYVSMLKEHSEDAQAKSRITLMESTPISHDLAMLPFQTAKFPGIFRDTKINLTGENARNLREHTNVLNGIATFSPIATPRSLTPASAPIGSHLPVRQQPSRQDSTSSAGVPSENGSGRSNGAFTWSAVARTNQHKPVTTAYQRENAEPSKDVKRNKQGYRLDDIPEYNREEVQRVKGLKMCNQKYLGINGCCHRPEKCPHRHDLVPSNAELKTLRVVARETPCKKGTGCEDPYCIYGHRCPYPAATEGSMRGAQCVAGVDCRFPLEMHNMDRTPVEQKKTILATGRF